MAYTPKNANGQAGSENSTPVVIASDQRPFPVLAGDRGLLPQAEGTLEQFTHDVNLARVFGTQMLVDLLGRIAVLAQGSQGVLQQKSVTLEQLSFDTGVNPLMATLVALIQSLIVSTISQSPSAPRLRVQSDLQDLVARLTEQEWLTTLQTEWDALVSRDYLLNVSQSVNGGAVGYNLALGGSGMSYYVMQEVR